MIRSLDISGTRLRRLIVWPHRVLEQQSVLCIKSNKTSNRRGFTLVEVMICLIIVMLAGMATIGAITYTRLNMELEKQRLAALGYCRQAMEKMQSLDTVLPETKILVPFNAPGVEDLNAQLKIEYYKFNEDASDPENVLQLGTVDWSSPLLSLSIDEPVFARVTVSWLPYGSIGRPQEISMSTVLTRGID